MNRPQKRARLISTLTLTTGDATVVIRIYEAMIDRNTRLARWAIYRRNGRIIKSERYAGKRRLAALDKELAETRADAEAWGATVTVEHPDGLVRYGSSSALALISEIPHPPCAEDA